MFDLLLVSFVFLVLFPFSYSSPSFVFHRPPGFPPSSLFLPVPPFKWPRTKERLLLQ